jgi:hypothetical protein
LSDLSGVVALAVDHPGSEAQAKRNILIGLSAALSALSERMRSQQDAAVKITVLAVRAEKIAEQSWALSGAKNANFQRDSEQLVSDIKAFADEVAEAAKRAGKEALLGREVARAISAHSDEIGRLAREIDTLPDATAVRVRLRPLSETLAALPERLKANAAAVKDIHGIAELAGGLAERSVKLSAGGLNAHREAVEMSRDLRRFAEEATAISLEMTRGSALAVKALDDMVGKTVDLSRGKPASVNPPPVHERVAVSHTRAPGKEVWVSTTSKQAAPAIPASTEWGAAAGRKK